MKKLFERFEQQSQQVEKVLEKSIELVRERKSPHPDLCSEIDAALRDLRSVYDEISEKLPEKTGGAAAPAEASVRELESLWQESVLAKQNSLKEVLSEFIRVYSDDDRYLQAIEEQLELARNLLTLVEKNEIANPDVSSYVVFLECVKQDLDENEELSNMLEDEGIKGFSGRAVGGLLKNKYYIRDEGSAEKPVQKEPVAEKPAPVKKAKAAKKKPVEEAEEKTPEVVPEVEQPTPAEEPESGVLGYVDTVNGRVKVKILQDTPESSAHASKYISKARERISQMVFSLNILMQFHMFPADKLDSDLQVLEFLSKANLEYLLSRGYAGKIAFETNGESKEYYVPSSMAYACMRKADVSRFVIPKLPKKDNFPEANDLIPVSAWSALFAYRCKLVVDYLLDMDDEYMFKIERGDPLKDWAYCVYPEIRGIGRTVAAGLLSESACADELKMISDYMQNPDNDLIILVEEWSEISVFVEKIAAQYPGVQERLTFAFASVPSMLLDCNGDVIESEDERSSEAMDGFSSDDLDFGIDEEGAISEEDFDEVFPDDTDSIDVPVDASPEKAVDSDEEQPVENKQVSEPQPAEQKAKPASGKKTQKADRKVAVESEQTEDVKAVEPSVPSESEQHIIKAKGAFAVDRFDVGNVILKGVCKLDNQYELLAKQYSFATGDPDNLDDYRPSNLLKYFPNGNGKDPENDLLFMASWLRMYFTEEASFESYHAREKKHMEGNLSNKYAPSLTDAVNALAEWAKNQGRGLDQDLLAGALKHSGVVDRLADVRKRAKEILESGELTHSTHYTNRIKATRDKLFGRDSEIYRQLQVVIRDDKSEYQTLKKELENYVSLDNAAVDVDEDEIEELIDDVWRSTVALAKGKAETAPLKGSERNTLRLKLLAVYRLLGTWLLAAGSSKATSTTENTAVVSLVDRIKPLLKAAISELGTKGDEFPELCGPLNVLQATLQELLQRIRCEFNEEAERKYYYAQLMKEPFVALDDDYLPHIEGKKEQVRPYEFCEGAEQYLLAEDKPWEDVIKRLFSTDEARNGADYGIARLLKDYLNEMHPDVHWPAEYDVDRAVERALDKNSKRSDSLFLWEQNFTARLEMADGDGWFTSTAAREKIDRIRNANFEAYCLQNNFGFYGRKLNHILEVLKSEASLQRPAYMERLDRLKASLSDEELSAPVLERIEKLINDDRFGAAESYLQLVEHGTLELRSNGLGDPNSEFNKFIMNCGALCRDAALSKKMVDIYRSQHKGVLNRNTKSGEDLLTYWPINSVHPDVIKRILGDLGLETERVNGDKQDNHYHAFFPDKGRIENYSHPIADFGSKMFRQGLDIILIFGIKNSDELFTEINAILQKTSSRPVLLLCNFAILLQERRKLAKKIATNLRTTAPCLLVDRALAFFLADCAMSERWKIMIQCALPFQPAQLQNPYFENSSVEIPPDMFIGRREELSTIIDPAGANLIYGGRQLGKTALLQRAKTLQHQPALNSWSAYVDIKNMDSVEAAKTVGKSLIQCGFLMQDTKIKNWTDLAEAIEFRLMTKSLTDDRLLLLIDEADHFLVEIESNKYKELDQFKRLQGTTEGRFKFVMAGLHNVLRFSQKALADNSGLPQLQGITVKPLSFSDARELLEIPLSYLGFMIRAGEEDVIAQILYNTNYFPGLVHFYASRLVKYMQKNMQQASMPPYTLDREVLTRILTDEDFRQQRVQRLKMTLGIDADQHSYYDALAHILCYYSLAYEEVMLYGMTAAEIRKECKSLAENSSIAKLDEQSIEALMDELVELNIFRRVPTEDKNRYLFSRTSFIEMLGTQDAVESHVLEILER